MTRSTRRSGFVLILAALALAALAPTTVFGASPSASPAATEAAARNLSVIVTFKGNSGKAATKAIERLGGKVKHQLGFERTLDVNV